MGAHWQSRNSGEWFEAVRDFAFAGVGDDATAVAPAATRARLRLFLFAIAGLIMRLRDLRG